MKNSKSLFVCISVLFAGILFLTSCTNSKRSASSGEIEITDIRIGTGNANIDIGTVIFNSDEGVILTFDVKNITTVSEPGKGEGSIDYYWLREDLTLRDKNGSIVLLKPGIINEKAPIYEKPLKFKNIFELPGIGGIKPGKYTVSLLVTDLIGFQTAVTEIPIQIK